MAVTFRYSTNQLLELGKKKCICLTRQTRRRLFYFKLYKRHIPTLISQKRLPQSRSVSRERCLTQVSIQPQRKSRSRREIPSYPSLLLSNVRCLTNKMDEVGLLLTRHSPDLAVFTESWLDSTSSDDAVHVQGYCLARRDRIRSLGGGIICYLKEDTTFTSLDEREIPSLQLCESEFLVLYIQKYHVLIVCLYHAFWNNTAANECAISCITDVLDFGWINYGPSLRVLLCGDFNDLRHSFFSISKLTLLTPLVNFPTRGSNCLDQIFVNFAFDQKPTLLPPIGLSDHSVILWQPAPRTRLPARKVKVRRMTPSRTCLLYTSPSPRDLSTSRMPSSA